MKSHNSWRFLIISTLVYLNHASFVSQSRHGSFNIPSLPTFSIQSSIGKIYRCDKVKCWPSQTSLKINVSPLADVAKLSAPVASLLVLALIILVHEAGHFLAARSLGIKVEEFSVGIGPKLFGFQENVDAGENNGAQKKIDFNFRAIPLGGFVRFPENYNSTLVFELEEEASKLREELKSSPVKQVKVQREPQLWTRLLNSFNLSSEPKKIQPRDKLIVRDDGTVEIPPIEYDKDPNLLQNRSWSDRAIVLVAGIVFNIILSFSLYLGEVSFGEGIPQPRIQSGALVKSILPESPSKGLLQEGDVIIALNGRPISASSPTAYGAQRSIAKFIDQIRSSTESTALHLSVYRPTIAESIDVDVIPKPLINNGQMSIGTMLSPNFSGMEFIKAKSPVDAVVKSFTAVSDLTIETARSLIGFFSSIIINHSLPAGQAVSGPIGVLKVGSDVISSNRISAVISFAAALSINLAVVNALPFPSLDGGQLVFVLLEAFTGKKIDQRRQEGITGAALFILLLVSVGTAIQDLTVLTR